MLVCIYFIITVCNLTLALESNYVFTIYCITVIVSA